MRPGFIYFKELALGDDNKFTLDFSDQEFAQEIDFLLNNDYYITSLDCKLKVKNHMHDDKKKNEELSEKSQLLLEKGAAYQNNLLLKTYWYVKQMDYTYCFKLFPEIINQYSYKYKFFDTAEKEIRDCKVNSPYLQLIGKGIIAI